MQNRKLVTILVIIIIVLVGMLAFVYGQKQAMAPANDESVVRNENATETTPPSQPQQEEENNDITPDNEDENNDEDEGNGPSGGDAVNIGVINSNQKDTDNGDDNDNGAGEQGMKTVSIGKINMVKVRPQLGVVQDPTTFFDPLDMTICTGESVTWYNPSKLKQNFQIALYYKDPITNTYSPLDNSAPIGTSYTYRFDTKGIFKATDEMRSPGEFNTFILTAKDC